MRRFVRKFLDFLLKFSVLFILVEVIWMLLPFAGFLYGSVFHIKWLNRNPDTAWLTHFVFPVNTMFPLGIILMLLGFALFLFGAAQIYTAKFRKTGLVTTGLYSRIRHPQYIALVLFGVGIILTWGRFTTFIAFFIMMFLYYRLAHAEERNCERLFGEAYEEYKTRTYLLFPGEAWIANIRSRLPRPGLPAWISAPLQFALVIGLSLTLGFFIQSVKIRFQKVPFITAEIESLPQITKKSLIPFIESKDGRLILVQGPFGPVQKESYAKRLIEMITSSPILQKKLDFLESPGEDRAVVLVGPQDGPPETMPGEKAKVELFIVRMLPVDPDIETQELLTNPGKIKFISAFVATLDPTIPQGRDPVIGCKVHPDMGISHRWASMMGRVKERIMSLGGDIKKGPRKLILVQAPIVRTRDKKFAQEIMDRLLRSETVKEMLAKYQVGGDILAVAFPRPGPNWYREHHGVPQIGAFIMLARKNKPLSDEQLFLVDMKSARKLEKAFIVEMDFAIPQPEDPVYQAPFIIGPLRDLEERWNFFLSGVK